MDGTERQAGAVAVVKGVRNPIALARAVRDHSEMIYLGGVAACDFARDHGVPFADDDYFITRPPARELAKEKEKAAREEKGKRAGTVGAVACDRDGHVAAATSTGGIPNARPGRIADSSMVGVGSYADDRTCAVSTTGDGEYAIRVVLAHDVACAVEYAGMPVRGLRAGDPRAQRGRRRRPRRDRGDADGRTNWAFNSERMHRGWRTGADTEAQARIWPEA